MLNTNACHKKPLWVVVLCLISLAVLSGCTTPRESLIKAWERDKSELQSRTASRFDSDTTVSSLRHKIWLSEINGAPLQYFVDKGYPSENELEVIARIDAISKQNFYDFRAYVTKYYPEHMAIAEAYGMEEFSLIQKLYEQKISYGEYHTLKREIVAKHAAAITERRRELEARIPESQSFATSAFTNFLIAQQLLNNINQAGVRSTQPNVNVQIYAPPPVNFRIPTQPGMIRR